jgi:DNA-binding NarL/FixJ family response regulator
VPLRILIVDDSQPFLQAARALLEGEGIDVVGAVTTAEEALARARELRPDVTLIDIDLGARSGFVVARQLVEADGAAGRMILISTHSEDEFADLIAASPVIGFLPKSTLSAEAVETLLAKAG